ncbi:MAG TPA: WxcM-like domain-containing protein [Casimicrobiaceae bacterium]
MTNIHDTALCDSDDVGEGTRLGAFGRVGAGARIGSACVIGDQALIDAGATLGDRVSIAAGVKIWGGVALEDDVRIAGDAAFVPPARESGGTTVHRGATIGANATIAAGVTIGAGAFVEPGAVVVKSVPPHAIVRGSPARIVGYVDLIRRDAPLVQPAQRHAITTTDVEGVTLHELLLVHDMRGDLSAGEFERQIPFPVRRYFIVFDVPSEDVRGEHAHRRCRQFLVCLRGRCRVVVDDGHKRAEIVLDRPNLGLYLPPMVWGIQYQHTSDALLLVFASEYYDPADYIRDYGEFLDAVKAKEHSSG